MTLRRERAPKPFYLNPHEEEPVLALLSPAVAQPRDTGVLICPPFGWTEVCSYRSRYEWAQDLSARGYPVVRLDLPGTGDSAGDAGNRSLIDAWLAAVSAAAQSLRDECECRRVAAIGIGIGGLIAIRAAAEGAPIDALALWALTADGRSAIRELRALARMQAAKLNVTLQSQQAGLPEGWSSFGGFVMSADTIASLEAIDLASDLADRSLRVPALLLGRDGIKADERLSEALRAAGASVETAPGPGYGEMTAEPHEAVAPHEVFETVAGWLERDSRAREGSRKRARRRRARARIPAGDGEIVEEVLDVRASVGSLAGVLSLPSTGASDVGLCAVLLNAGAIRRIGPSRLWVELARRWALTGVPSLRIDMQGIGDSVGQEHGFEDAAVFHEPERLDQVRACLDALEQRGIAKRFVLIGLCSGSHWAFQGALADERVVAALMLNARMLFWDRNLESMRYARRALRMRAWRIVLGRFVRPARLLTVARQLPSGLIGRALAVLRRRGDRAPSVVDSAFDVLAARGTRVLFAFSGEEPLHEELIRDGVPEAIHRWPNISFEQLPGNDHPLRPLSAQRAAHSVLDRALENELGRSEAPNAETARRQLIELREASWRERLAGGLAANDRDRRLDAVARGSARP